VGNTDEVQTDRDRDTVRDFDPSTTNVKITTAPIDAARPMKRCKKLTGGERTKVSSSATQIGTSSAWLQ
jgi:hypothetical protein